MPTSESASSDGLCSGSGQLRKRNFAYAYDVIMDQPATVGSVTLAAREVALSLEIFWQLLPLGVMVRRPFR
jgi:hypothetical protein